MAESVGSWNPFARRESHGSKTLNAYRTLTPLSWILVVLFGIYYSVRHPADVSHGTTVGDQTNRHPTPFSQHNIVTGIYWIILLLSQLGYIGQLWSSNADKRKAAANVAPYYILNNLFVFAFILLWVRSYFWGAEVIDIANLLSQGTLYWKHRDLPTSIHLPAVAGPYAWSLSALFWNGAVAVGGQSKSKSIAANVFAWVYFVIGQGHIIHRSDHQLGYAHSLLSLSLALKQYSIKTIPLQWIFFFIIFGIFFVTSANSSITRYFNRSFFFRSRAEADATDRERQPLLSSE